MGNGSIVDALDDSFSVSSCGSGDGGGNSSSSTSSASSSCSGSSSTSNNGNERNCLNRHVRYRRRRLRHNNSDGDNSDRRFSLNNISNCGSFVRIDSSDLIAECQNQFLCAHYEANMDCVRLKRRRRSSDASISSQHVELRTKDQSSFFRRGYAAIRNSFNSRNSRRYRYMKSVSLAMAETPADQNNNENGRNLRTCRSFDLRKGSASDRSPYRQVTYVRDLSSSAGCIDANGSDGGATPQIR